MSIKDKAAGHYDRIKAELTRLHEKYGDEINPLHMLLGAAWDDAVSEGLADGDGRSGGHEKDDPGPPPTPEG